MASKRIGMQCSSLATLPTYKKTNKKGHATNHHAPLEARGEVKAIKVRKSTHLKGAQGLNLNSDSLGF